MQPIINPWIFYLIDILDSLNFIATVIIIGAFFILLIGSLDISNPISCDDMQRGKKMVKWGMIAFLISGITLVLTPPKDTMYTMLTSSMVTEDNLDKATKAIQDGVDYIFEKMEGEEN